MKIKYSIVASLEGELGELINAKAPSIPQLAEVLALMGNLAFVVETVAHLQGKEKELLPMADKARAMIEKLGGGA